MPKHITLVGMPGSGKTTVAPMVAAQLKRKVIEVDALIEAQEGMPIGEIFIAKGEAYFRRTECAMIARLIDEPPAVLSLGGGAFIWEETRRLLLAQTVVFYLSASLEVLCARVQAGVSTRPLLSMSGVSLQETMLALLAKRGACYALAHYRIETDLHPPEDVAKSVMMMRGAYE